MNLNKKIRAAVSVALLVMACALSCEVSAQITPPPSLCVNRGYVLGFFNGVWNGEDDADSGLEALRVFYGDTYNNEPLVGEVFYNHTGSTVGATSLQDIAETFIQRANDIDSSGSLSSHFEFFWDVISDGDRSFWDRVISVFPAAASTLDALYSELSSQFVAALANLVSNPPTAADYSRHNARLDELVLQGQKLLLVAHSQGNLFVNQAYDHASARASAGSIKVAHVAPASATLRGEHRLANIDLIINGLRAEGIGSVPPINLILTPSFRDASGHTLIGTYLDGSRPGRASVKAMLDSAIASLVTPSAQAGLGFFTVTLTWNGSGDVDLHTFEPNGVHVFYASRTGSSGFLDVDNVVANGPEHYFATCDPQKLQTGVYQIGINNYSSATGRTATVQAASVQTGDLLTRVLDVGPVRGSSGNNSPIPVLTVTVTKDVAGNYSVTAQ